MKRVTWPLLMTALAAFMLGACTSSASAAKDVLITACTPGTNGGHPVARGQIINHSSKASLYTIHVKFSDASGNKVGDGLAAVAKVDSKAKAAWHATGTFSAKGPLKCSLSSVTRNAAP